MRGMEMVEILLGVLIGITFAGVMMILARLGDIREELRKIRMQGNRR